MPTKIGNVLTVGMEVKILEGKKVIDTVVIRGVTKSGDPERPEVRVESIPAKGFFTNLAFFGNGDQTEEAEWRILFEDPMQKGVRCFSQNAPKYLLQPV
jgi:hypothetical protein